MMKVIYLDYNASTPIDTEVADYMIPFLRENYGNPSSNHWYGVQTRLVIEEARKNVANLINSEKSEIIFTSGGTESNNLAIIGSAYSGRNKGNHIITSRIEHPAVLEVCKDLEKKGFEVSYISVDNYGVVNVDELKAAIKDTTILVSIMHANNETGTIQPINEISSLLKNRDILFHCDAAQSAGKIIIDVNKMVVDLLSLAGHKFYGPKGVGALYIRKGVEIEKIMQGANHERNIRPGTENVLEIAGLGKAAQVAKRDFRKNTSQMAASRDQLFERLKKYYPAVVRNGHPVNVLPNTLNISFPGVDAGTLLSELTGLAASAGAACHADEIELSHVLKAMNIPQEIAMGTIRLSTGKNSGIADIEAAAEMLGSAAQKLSGSSFVEILAGPSEKYALTKFTHGLGCACKISPKILEEVLKDFPTPVHPDILVGSNTSDDAAVYRINEETAIVQTVDFFTPVIDDPYRFGAIAASNALSDIYAMGATPLFGLNIVAFPTQRLPMEVLKNILAGAREVAEEAGIHILGGHTIEDNEPKFGMVITGIIHPSKILRNSEAKAGDSIFLTKAIGTGILSTAMKKGMTSEEINEELYLSMRELNRKASDVIRNFQISACTDVTGFGLLGHLLEMVRGSGISAEIYSDKVPLLNKVYEYASMDIIPGGTLNNLAYIEKSTHWAPEIDDTMKVILCDAQTSGGLMFTAPPGLENEILGKLHESGIHNAVVIGRFTNDSENLMINVV